MPDLFLTETKKIQEQISQYLRQPYFSQKANPEIIREGFLLYPSRESKLIRPLILCFCCGAVGGNIDSVIPAAASVELFHTWTIMHDDIIDSDELRRGGKSAHIYFRDYFRKIDSNNLKAALGNNLSMLSGDLQHSIAISMLTRLYTDYEHNPSLVLKLINELEYNTLPELIEGEVEDILLSQKNIDEVTFEDILKMVSGKTASLLSYSAYAGAVLGLDALDEDHHQVKVLSRFGHHLGIAFQLRDDLNGLLKSDREIGKPQGSDIKEKKKTFILWYAFNAADNDQKKIIINLLQKKSLNKTDIKILTNLLIELGGVRYTEDLLKKHIEFAFLELNSLPSSRYRDYLGLLAQKII
jgi:geranylgeranyl diphosphate synthase, type I